MWMRVRANLSRVVLKFISADDADGITVKQPTSARKYRCYRFVGTVAARRDACVAFSTVLSEFSAAAAENTGKRTRAFVNKTLAWPSPVVDAARVRAFRAVK